jgi:mono/diheme cytochrome c family protein
MVPNGRYMQVPPEGTVALGHLDDDELYDDGWDLDPVGIDGGRTGHPDYTFKFPPQVAFPDAGIDEAIVTRGQLRYNIYCTPCHGVVGAGDGMIVQRGFKAPPSYHIDRLRQAPPGYFFDVVTRGFGTMNSYAAQIKVEDRWAIIAYIRALQLSQNATLDDVPAAERASLEPAGH